MTAINRGSCFWCGAKVSDADWDYVGDNRVWICNEHECNRLLSREQQEAVADRYYRAEQDEFMRY